MKDEQTNRILLEAITSDSATILKIVSQLAARGPGVSEKPPEEQQAIKVLLERVEKTNELLEKIETSKPTESEQQRHINLLILLERIWKRLNPGENLLLHYFTPLRIGAHTIVWILLIFVLGALADKLYTQYRVNRIEVITNQPINQ